MGDNQLMNGGKDGSTETGTGGMVRCPETDHTIGDSGAQISEVMEALASTHRRYALYYLREEERADLGDVAEQVAARQTATPPEDLDEQTRQRIRIELHHVHLPKLEKAGLITYNDRHGAIQDRHWTDSFETVLDYCEAIESPDTCE